MERINKSSQLANRYRTPSKTNDYRKLDNAAVDEEGSCPNLSDNEYDLFENKQEGIPNAMLELVNFQKKQTQPPTHPQNMTEKSS